MITDLIYINFTAHETFPLITSVLITYVALWKRNQNAINTFCIPGWQYHTKSEQDGQQRENGRLRHQWPDEGKHSYAKNTIPVFIIVY